MSEPLWHPKTADALVRFIARPGHAIIIGGQPGSGKAATGRWLATQLLGREERTLTPDVFLWLAPDGKQISIEQVRRAVAFSKTKLDGDALGRVIVFDQAQTMGDPAQNALLKLLEEPTPGIVIILLTSSVMKLKATIRSRSRSLEILPLDLAQARTLQGSASDELFKKAFMLSGGRAADLSRLLTSKDLDGPIAAAKEYLSVSRFERVLKSGEVKDREEAVQFVAGLQLLCQSALESTLKQTNTKLHRAWLARLSACYQATEQLERNANIKLAMDYLALELV